MKEWYWAVIGHGLNPEKGLFLCSLQHVGGNTRYLKAQRSVEYKKQSSHEKSCTFVIFGAFSTKNV